MVNFRLAGAVSTSLAVSWTGVAAASSRIVSEGGVAAPVGLVFTETLMEQLAVAVNATRAVESVILAVKFTRPPVVGVPVMSPVEAFRVRPAGSDDAAAKEYV